MIANDHEICAPCRYATKYVPGPCPHCGQALVSMGKNFKAPRKNDVAQWHKLALIVELWRTGKRHHPECWYSKHASTSTQRWTFCRCPWLKNFRTFADVKSGLGLRRNRQKNWAPVAIQTGHGRPRFDYGR